MPRQQLTSDGDPLSSKMSIVGKPDAAKVVVWTVVLGGAFAIGMLLLIQSVTKSAREKALQETKAEVERH